MSEENIKVRAVIRTDIRNPFSNIVILKPNLAAQYDRRLYPEWYFTKDSILRLLRNISHSKFLDISISSKEIQAIHSLQELFINKATIDEIEISAESVSTFELKLDTPLDKQINQTTDALVATLKIPRIQMRYIVPTKETDGALAYYLRFNLSGGSSLVSY